MDIDARDPSALALGGTNFRDVTSIFAQASQEMEPGSMVTVEGFSLNDAMSAIEIGEPRLDTGMQITRGIEAQFDPLTPLLPQEICWIIDQSMAYETEWYAANPLAHTVFTMLHVHNLDSIDPDVLSYLPAIDSDQKRPLELITVILRAYICALLKSCHLSWTELSRGSLLDTEDWQSDKCEVSLLEGWPVQAALARLDAAAHWLDGTTKVPPLWQESLKTRLEFRRCILLLLNISSNSTLTREYEEFMKLIEHARGLLSILRAQSSSSSPSPSSVSISPTSPAHLAFDPYIARKLNTFLPVRVIDVPTPEQTWDAYERMLDGWEELGRLSRAYNLSIWDQVGFHQVWFNAPAAQPAFIRSCIQSLFFAGTQILHIHPQSWIIDRFFKETLGVSYTAFMPSPGTGGDRVWAEVKTGIIHTLLPHIQSQWSNPSRRRRFLAKSILDWHMVYERLCVLVEELDQDDFDPPRSLLLNSLPKIALLWRLSSVREVILSGFQLELYHPLERPFAYWFAAEVIGVHLVLLKEIREGVEALKQVAESATSASHQEAEMKLEREYEYQYGFLSALHAMSRGMFVLLIRTQPPNPNPNPNSNSNLNSTAHPIFAQWNHLRAQLRRRFKWAFDPAYESGTFEFEPVIGEPDFMAFLKAVGEVLGQGQGPSQSSEEGERQQGTSSEHFGLGEGFVRDLLAVGSVGVLDYGDGYWARGRTRILQGMLQTCQEMRTLAPQSNSESGPLNSRFSFPSLSPSSSVSPFATSASKGTSGGEGNTSQNSFNNSASTSETEVGLKLDWTWSFSRNTPKAKKTPWFPSVLS